MISRCLAFLTKVRRMDERSIQSFPIVISISSSYLGSCWLHTMAVKLSKGTYLGRIMNCQLEGHYVTIRGIGKMRLLFVLVSVVQRCWLLLLLLLTQDGRFCWCLSDEGEKKIIPLLKQQHQQQWWQREGWRTLDNDFLLWLLKSFYMIVNVNANANHSPHEHNNKDECTIINWKEADSLSKREAERNAALRRFVQSERNHFFG